MANSQVWLVVDNPHMKFSGFRMTTQPEVYVVMNNKPIFRHEYDMENNPFMFETTNQK
jgi:hypothetical protein